MPEEEEWGVLSVCSDLISRGRWQVGPAFDPAFVCEKVRPRCRYRVQYRLPIPRSHRCAFKHQGVISVHEFLWRIDFLYLCRSTACAYALDAGRDTRNPKNKLRISCKLSVSRVTCQCHALDSRA